MAEQREPVLTPTRPMQRWTAFLFAALTVTFVAAVVLTRGAHGPAPSGAADAGADAARDATVGKDDPGRFGGDAA